MSDKIKTAIDDCVAKAVEQISADDTLMQSFKEEIIEKLRKNIEFALDARVTRSTSNGGYSTGSTTVSEPNFIDRTIIQFAQPYLEEVIKEIILSNEDMFKSLIIATFEAHIIGSFGSAAYKSIQPFIEGLLAHNFMQVQQLFIRNNLHVG